MADEASTQAAPQERAPIPGIPMPPNLDMSWAKVPTERPPKPTIGDQGFTLAMADFGAYGTAPDHWPYFNDTPRGSYAAKPREMGPPAPYTIYDKYEVWAENSAELYEQAIREQWKPATEISWNSIEPLSDVVEASLDQIFSNISEQQYNSLQVMGGWFKQISYGYHEVKLYLSTQVFEQARHVEAFRKRALSNGGGLGMQTPGFFSRSVYAAFKFTEYVFYVNILRTSWLLGLCEYGSKNLARSQADRQLFDNTANDLRRQLSFGIAHIKQYVLTDPQRRYNILNWMDRGEVMWAADLRRDKALKEACILALGSTVAEGKEKLKELRMAQATRYLQTLEACTIVGHELRGVFKDVVENP